MGKITDLTGKRFGRLIVIGKAENQDGPGIKWECVCDCGRTTAVVTSSLVSGTTRSCGCLAHEVRVRIGASSAGRKSPKRLDLAGKVFGRLTVLEAVPRYNKPLRWLCRCECGKETLVATSKLTTGKTQSCGCLGLENATKAKIKHGATKTRLYNVWHTMKDRCSNPRSNVFKWYGAKGIAVCSEWMDFARFQEWSLSHGYAEGLAIDRIDPNKDYCPENCRWITGEENSRRIQRVPEGSKEKAFALIESGMSVPNAARAVGVSVPTLYKWRKNAV